MAYDGAPTPERGRARRGSEPLTDETLRTLVSEAARIQAAIAGLEAERVAVFTAGLDLALQHGAEVSRRGSDAELAVRSLAAEFGAALRVSDSSMQGQLSRAQALVREFPATHAALADGAITFAHATVIQRAGSGISDPVARAEFEQHAIAVALTESAGRLKALIAGKAEEAHDRTMTERHQAARRERRVDVFDDVDGMSTLWVRLPSVLAHGIIDRVVRMAREVKNARVGFGDTGREPGREPGGIAGVDACAEPHTEAPSAAGLPTGSFDDRTLPQITADVFADLLLAGTPGGDGLSAIHATVHVTIPVTSLAGASEAGAMLAGVGAVDADTVRALAGVAPGWNRVITDPVTGIIHTVDRYRPSTEIRRLLQTRDEHCRFPGCRRPAHRTDLDHTHDHAHGGDTAIDNLAHLCRRHHTLKHHTRWKVRSRGNGVLEWTSPLGETYTDTPPNQISANPPPPPVHIGDHRDEPTAPF